MSAWKSIKTAPKDGSQILLGRNLGPGHTNMVPGYWNERLSMWVTVCGGGFDFLTHWRPLLSLPPKLTTDKRMELEEFDK